MAAAVDQYLTEITFNGVAGEALAEGDLVGISSAGTVWKADANATHGASATHRCIGVAVRGVAAGGTVAIAPIAVVSGLSSLTAGGPVYLSTTAGGYTATGTTTNTETRQWVGMAISTTKALVMIGTPFIYQTAGNSTVAFGT